MNEIGFQDERLADGSVCRRYEDGRTEWRTRLDDHRVRWRDANGAEGEDEFLGDGIIKRTAPDRPAEYARDQGYGRTAWMNDLLTINRIVTVPPPADAAFTPPPASLTPAEEEALRKKRSASIEVEDEEGGDGDGWGSTGPPVEGSTNAASGETADLGDGDFG